MVLVTGAGGMLGSHIVDVLLQSGYRVKAMVLPGSPAKNLQGKAVEWHYGNVLDANACAEAVRGCRLVIHTAASLSTWPARSATQRAINIDGTKNIVQAAQAAGIQRFIHVSSASSFGPAPGGQIATEQTPFRGDHYGLDYIDSKHAAQEYVLGMAREHGFPALVICPTFMIGPNDVNLGSGQMIIAVCRHKLPFLPPGGKNFVYVRDVAQTVVNALRMGGTGEAYIAGHGNLSYRQFFGLVGQITGAPAPRWMLPGWLILAFGLGNSTLASLFHFRPLLSYSQAKTSVDKQYYSPAKAVQELQMPQTDLGIAIKEASEWLKQEGHC